MSKLAFVFPGQGSQTVGMLSEFADIYPVITETFKEASSVLGYSLWDLVQEGPAERLNETIYTQVAMLVADVAMFRVIKQISPKNITLMAGHSLGEYAALVCSESLELVDAVGLVRERARLMQQHVPLGIGAMAAIVGLDDEVVIKLCHDTSNAQQKVMPANYNAIGQVVVAGDKEAVDRLIVAAEEQGARLARLIPVSVPCHCELLQEAAKEFGIFLEKIQFKDPNCLVLSNVDAQNLISGLGLGPTNNRQGERDCNKAENSIEQNIYSQQLDFRRGANERGEGVYTRYMTEDERDCNKAENSIAKNISVKLQKQLYMPVQWVHIIQSMVNLGITKIIECGPGQVLSGLIKRIDRTVSIYNVNNQDALEKIRLLGE